MTRTGTLFRSDAQNLNKISELHGMVDQAVGTYLEKGFGKRESCPEQHDQFFNQRDNIGDSKYLGTKSEDCSPKRSNVIEAGSTDDAQKKTLRKSGTLKSMY
jgi:hypothetical protein